MAEIIRPLLTGKPFESTAHRLYTMFQPIQATRSKHSDFVAYAATPALDWFVLDSIFALDVAIRILNVSVSLLKAAYNWTLKQQKTDDLIDKATERELDDVVNNLYCIYSALVGQVANMFISLASLVTRPIASIVEALSDDTNEEPEYSFVH